jgi:pimeloyl-ACP methyl ester carboxylesterase
MDLVDIGAGRVAYDSRGDGPVAVLSHASLVDRRMWRGQLDALSQRYRVVAFDRLGFGDSTHAPESVRYGRELLEVLDALDIDQATLIGCSMGGGYSLDAALLAPERITGLALICSGVPGYEWPAEMLAEVGPLLRAAVPSERLAEYSAHTAATVLDEDITAMAEAQARYMVVGPDRTPSDLDPTVWAFALEMTQGVFARMWRDPASAEIDPEPPLLERLAEVSVPTLVLTGLADVPYIRDLSDRLATGIRGARRIDLADTGHLPPLERAAGVNAALLEFLDSVNATA